MAVLVDFHTGFGRGVFAGILSYCREHPGWHTFYSWEHSVAEMKRALSEGQADGVVVEIRKPEQLRLIRQYKVPTVDVSGEWETTHPFRVQSNDEAAGRLAARHLVERGFKNFGYYYSYRWASSGGCFERRRKGFLSELATAGFSCDTNVAELAVPWHCCTLAEMAGEREALAKWLVKLPKPVGLMCADDYKAEEVAIVCRDQGIHIPKDVALVGVGNDDLACQICDTPLSSVDIAPHKIGYAAARVVDCAARTQKMPSKPVLIEPLYVVVRGSSNIFASDNKELIDALTFIQEHAHEPLRVGDVLRKVPMSRRALENAFRTHVGRSPGEQICHVHVERARKLLAETDLPLRTVSDLSGFTSASSLSDVFLREIKLRPGEYRRQARAVPSQS
jgi:LacI family transcriptional regulator